MTLGENLQRLRRAKGLSQEEVAQKLFISRQSISKWELDQAEPGVENLKALARLYGVTLDELMGVEQVPEPERPERVPCGPDPEEERCVSWYRYALAGASTAMVLVENLISMGEGRMNFPFSWLLILLGLGVRKSWVWVGILALKFLDLVICGLFLMMGSWIGGSLIAHLVALALHGALLWATVRRETKIYFHVSEEG